MELKQLWQFCVHFVRGRWIVVAFSLYIMSCAGATYIFGVYSGSIKHALLYDQQTIDTLSFFKDLGANVGIVSGLLNEFTPSWAVVGVGAAMNLFGYLMIWLAVTGKIARPRVWQMYLYICVGANSQTFANTGVLVTCVKNFPQSRGVVIGLLKGFVGLSGAIFTQIYHALYGQDTKGVILLVGWLPSLVSLLLMFFIRPMTPEMDKNEGKHFFSFLYLALLLAGFLMAIIIIENLVPLSPLTFKAMGVITVLLVVSTLWISVRAELEKVKQKSEAENSQSRVFLTQAPGGVLRSNASSAQSKIASDSKEVTQNGESKGSDQKWDKPEDHKGDKPEDEKAPAGQVESCEPSHSDAIQAKSSPNLPPNLQAGLPGTGDQQPYTLNYPPHRTLHQQYQASAKASVGIEPTAQISKQSFLSRVKFARKTLFSNWPERGDDFTIPQALMSLDMWILFLATTAGVGATLTAIDNMGQIGASLGYSSISITTFVSLISIWNFLGRVFAGFFSEFLLQKYRFPRTLMHTIVLALACVGHMLIAFPSPGSLYVASIVIGFCFGAQWPVLYAVISELFGLKYYATLYNLGAVASPVGSYLLNVRVAGYLYDREARKQQAQLLSGTGSRFSVNEAASAPAPMSIARSDLTCNGAECFRLTFLIMTIVSLFGSLVSVLLVLRTRKFYSQDIYAKFREPAKELDSQAQQSKS